MQETYEITRSKHGLPVVGVGGGSATNTFEFRAVYRRFPRSNDRKEGFYLAPGLFVRRGGDLSCRRDQAGVVVQRGDLIIEAYGSHRKGMQRVSCKKVMAIPATGNSIYVEDIAEAEKIEIDLPDTLREAAMRYHNRDGRPFVGSLPERKPTTTTAAA